MNANFIRLWHITSIVAIAAGVLLNNNAWADRVTSNTYYANGLLRTQNGPRTDVADITRYHYTQGFLSKITNALGHERTFNNHDGRGLPASQIDENGIETRFAYHPRGWLTSSAVMVPDGAGGFIARTTTFDYDNIGQVTRVTLPDGSWISFEYDAAQRLTAIENTLGERIEYTLDNAGNRTAQVMKNAEGGTTFSHQRAYDELSRVLTETGANGQRADFGYDKNGNETARTDALANATQQAHDALNRVRTLTDADNNEVKFTYDVNDRITSITDQRGLTTTYSYNVYGDLTRERSPDTGITTYKRDQAGNVKRKTDARGVVTEYTYDALNRVLTERYAASPTEDVTYTYDSTDNGNKGVGRLTGITNEHTSLTFRYDARGNTVEVLQSIGGELYATAYGYDATDNIVSIIYPSGRLVHYQRDAVGQITSVTTQSNANAPVQAVATGIGYLPYGGVQALTYGNGVQTTLGYDQDYRIATINTVGAGAVQDKLYTYDLADNISGITDGSSNTQSKTFSYDALYRVTQDVGTYGAKTYTYDTVGNRTQRVTESVDDQGQPVTTHQRLRYAKNSNRIIKRSGKATIIDEAGNTISESNARKEFLYNNAHRLIRYTKDGIAKADYVYNAMGQRVQKLKHNDAGTVEYHYFYDQNGQLLADHVLYANGASAEFEYIWLNNIPLARYKTAYRVNGAVNTSKLQTTWIHTDHLNTPRIGTNDDQTIVWRWDGDAFGVGATNNDPDGDGTKHYVSLRFPGQVKDGESGLHYNYFRDYDPSTGRYIQSDPIGLAGGFNTYSYVHQNPLINVDPNGLNPLLKQIKNVRVEGPRPSKKGDGTGSLVQIRYKKRVFRRISG